MASIGPMPSNASTGTTRNVISDQIAPPMPAMMSPANPARSRTTASRIEIAADTAAHVAITPMRPRATPLAAAMSGSCPRSAWSAPAARATL